jgi:hypothetical protein
MSTDSWSQAVLNPKWYLPTLQDAGPSIVVYASYVNTDEYANTLHVTIEMPQGGGSITFENQQPSGSAATPAKSGGGPPYTKGNHPNYGQHPDGGIFDCFYLYFDYSDERQPGDTATLCSSAQAQSIAVSPDSSANSQFWQVTSPVSQLGVPLCYWVIFPIASSVTLDAGDEIGFDITNIISPCAADFTTAQSLVYVGGQHRTYPSGAWSLPFTRAIMPIATLSADRSGPVTAGTEITFTCGIEQVGGQGPVPDTWTLTGPNEANLGTVPFGMTQQLSAPTAPTTYFATATMQDGTASVESTQAQVMVEVITIGEPQLTSTVMGVDYTIGIQVTTEYAVSGVINLAGDTTTVSLELDAQSNIVCELSSSDGTSLQVIQNGVSCGSLSLPDMSTTEGNTLITLELTALNGNLAASTRLSLTLIPPQVRGFSAWSGEAGQIVTDWAAWEVSHALEIAISDHTGKVVTTTSDPSGACLTAQYDDGTYTVTATGFGVASQTCNTANGSQGSVAEERPAPGGFQLLGVFTDLAWLQTGAGPTIWLFASPTSFGAADSGAQIGEGLVWGGVGPDPERIAQLVWLLSDGGLYTVQWNETEWETPQLVRGGSGHGKVGTPSWAGVGNFRGVSGCDLAWLQGETLFIFEGDSSFDTANNGVGTTGLGAGVTWGGVGRFDDGTDQMVWFTPNNSESSTGSLSLVRWNAKNGQCVQTSVASGIPAPAFAAVGDFNGDGIDELAWLVDGTLYLRDATQSFAIIGWTSVDSIVPTWGGTVPTWGGAGRFSLSRVYDLWWFLPSKDGSGVIQSLKWTGSGWAVGMQRGEVGQSGQVGAPVWAGPPGGAAVWPQ